MKPCLIGEILSDAHERLLIEQLLGHEKELQEKYNAPNKRILGESCSIIDVWFLNLSSLAIRSTNTGEAIEDLINIGALHELTHICSGEDHGLTEDWYDFLLKIIS